VPVFQKRFHDAVEQDGGRWRSRAMNNTFLHADKTLPQDEQVDTAAPECPACGKPMWLNCFTRRASDDGVLDVRNYECRSCGAVKDITAQAAMG